MSLGLAELGLQRGDKVCIIGDNDPQYFWAQLAVQSGGGVAVGIFTDSTPPEIQYVVEHSDAVFVFAKDQEQCDKLLDTRDQIPKVRRVIYWDDKGLWNYDDPWLTSFAEVQALGRALDEAQPDLFEIEHEVRDVFEYTRHRRKFVHHVPDADGRNRRPP